MSVRVDGRLSNQLLTWGAVDEKLRRADGWDLAQRQRLSPASDGVSCSYGCDGEDHRRKASACQLA
jgi:hypothetical protein